MITLHGKTYGLRQVSDTAAFNTDECAGRAFNLPVNSMEDLELRRQANKLMPCDPAGEWGKVRVENERCCMSNPLFKRKPMRETITFKISTRGIPPLTRAMQERIENRARDPSLYRSFPEMEEIGDLMAASLENGRHSRLTKQRWSGADEKEWMENREADNAGCGPRPSVPSDSTGED